jgi:hypothetical protein
VYPAQQPSSSSRAINGSHQSQAVLPRPSTSHTSNRSRPQGQYSQPLAHHINQPLKPHVWSSHHRRWTRRDLDRERIDFFDTRVTGQPEIWQAIRAALEILWSGGDDMEHDGGLATAQQILDAAGITVPTGDMHGGVYDEMGAYYQLPEHIVSDPTTVVDDTPVVDIPRQSEQADGGTDADEENAEELRRRREDRGKGVDAPEDMVVVKARRSDGIAQDLEIRVAKKESVRLLTRKFYEESQVSI